MSLIIFLIVVVIIYLIATQIKVVHLDTLPKKNKQEINDRTYLKSLLTSSYVRCDDVNLPDINDLIKTVRSTRVKNGINFNVANRPVAALQLDGSIYSSYVKNDMNKWDSLLRVTSIQPLDIVEAGDDLLITARVEVTYCSETAYLMVGYYSQKSRLINFFTNQGGIGSIELLTVKQIDRNEFNADNQRNTFMSMGEQMQYVDHVNRLHADEIRNQY